MALAATIGIVLNIILPANLDREEDEEITA